MTESDIQLAYQAELERRKKIPFPMELIEKIWEWQDMRIRGEK